MRYVALLLILCLGGCIGHAVRKETRNCTTHYLCKGR